MEISDSERFQAIEGPDSHLTWRFTRAGQQVALQNTAFLHRFVGMNSFCVGS